MSDADDNVIVLNAQCNNDALCQRCAQLDLDLLFSGSAPELSTEHFESWYGFSFNPENPTVHGAILQIGSLSTADEESTCPVCRFWSLCRHGDDDLPYLLNQVAWRDTRKGGLSGYDGPPLFTVRNQTPIFELGDYSVITSNPFNSTANTGHYVRTCELVDFELVRSWMARCIDKHSECKTNDQTPDQKNLIQVIDCEDGGTCKARPRTLYAALSYVWGVEQTPSAADGTRGIASYPLLIRDAMFVTRSLGLRYLWVDRYCITASDQALKMEQIRNMDIIFERAQVVIVSLGQSPDEGLPGISTVRKINQPCLKLTKGAVRGSIRDPQDQIRRSKWNRRGWTLQEAILARRKLFFTEDQVHFECKQVHECELMVRSRLPVTGKNWRLPGFSEDDRSWLGLRLEPTMDVSNFMELLANYNTRALTYDSDALNAFLGIISRYTRSLSTLKHYYGLPFEILDDSENEPISEKQAFLTSSFFKSLGWCVPRYSGNATRRHEFPSWTWAGWTGGYNDLVGGTARTKDVQIWVERLDGETTSLIEFVKGGGLDLPISQLSRFIWLEALHVRTEFLEYPTPDPEGLGTYLALLWDDDDGTQMFYLAKLENRFAVADLRLYTNWQTILLEDVSGISLVIADRDGVTEKIPCAELDGYGTVEDAIYEKASQAFPNVRRGTQRDIKWNLKKTRLG